jgi:hypothetical protein
MPSDGKTFMGRLIKADGAVEDVELVHDNFFLDSILESEIGINADLIDFYLVKEHAVAFNTMARLTQERRNGVASKMVGFTVYGDVLFIPRQYIREA